MNQREFKQTAYLEISSIVKSISNPHRLEIVDVLSNGEKSVEQIASETDLSIANASQHLQILKRSKWVKSRREKNFIYYDLKNQFAFAIWKTIREFARLQIPEINTAVEDYRKSNHIESIKYSDVDMQSRFLLVDARPVKEFNSGHLENALSIYSKEGFPKNTDLLVYSRGPFCTLADEAVSKLNQEGFTARRLEEGYRDILR